MILGQLEIHWDLHSKAVGAADRSLDDLSHYTNNESLFNFLLSSFEEHLDEMHARRAASSITPDTGAFNGEVGPIIVERGRVTGVTLNRPEKRNAITRAMWRELGAIFQQLGSDETVRAVVLTGRDCFSAGADITEFSSERSNGASVTEYEDGVSIALRQLKEMPKPTIAAIHSHCVGGGLALALACDFRLGDSTSKFSIPAAKLGIIFSTEECRALTAIVGSARAKQTLLRGAPFDAAYASRIGLIDLVEDGDVLPAARALAHSMADNSPNAVSGMKFILNCLSDGNEKDRSREIDALIKQAADSREYRDAIARFGAKRNARFDN